MSAITNDLETGDSAGFWRAAAEGRLVFQRCRGCSQIQHPPRFICAACWSDDLEEVESSGRGRIESLTVVRRAPTPSYRSKVPYVVVAVAMAEGPRMIANLIDDDAIEAQPDEPVTVCFVADDGGRILPQFRRGRDDG